MEIDLNKELELEGFIVIDDVFSREEILELESSLHNFKIDNSESNREIYAIRNLIGEIPGLKDLIFNHNLKTILSRIENGLFMSKAIYFDKPAQSNWYVTWHQDSTINVSDRIEVEGYYGWTRKGKGRGVCPPEKVLHKTVTLRIHLDDTTRENGALMVIPGSQKKKLSDEELALTIKNSIPKICEVGSGGVQLMKPLLLHASSKTTNNKKRRVIHLEFNSTELPKGMEWAERVEV